MLINFRNSRFHCSHSYLNTFIEIDYLSSDYETLIQCLRRYAMCLQLQSQFVPKSLDGLKQKGNHKKIQRHGFGRGSELTTNYVS